MSDQQHVLLEIRLHDKEKTPYAEWELGRVDPAYQSGDKWLGHGTCPSLEAAIDHAMDCLRLYGAEGPPALERTE